MTTNDNDVITSGYYQGERSVGKIKIQIKLIKIALTRVASYSVQGTNRGVSEPLSIHMDSICGDHAIDALIRCFRNSYNTCKDNAVSPKQLNEIANIAKYFKALPDCDEYVFTKFKLN